MKQFINGFTSCSQWCSIMHAAFCWMMEVHLYMIDEFQLLNLTEQKPLSASSMRLTVCQNRRKLTQSCCWSAGGTKPAATGFPPTKSLIVMACMLNDKCLQGAIGILRSKEEKLLAATKKHHRSQLEFAASL